MSSIVSYVRYIMGSWLEDNRNKINLKRDRSQENEYSPIGGLKRLKAIPKTIYPETMSSKDELEDSSRTYKNVRIVPIEIEDEQPTTSTPYERGNKENRIRAIPMRLVGRQNGSLSPVKSRKNNPSHPIHALVLDNDEDEEEVTLVEPQPSQKKTPQLYINVNDDDENYDKDVVFVKTISPARKPLKLFPLDDTDLAKFMEPKISKYSQYRKIVDKGSPRSSSLPRNNYGISKAYKKPSTTSLPNWLREKTKYNQEVKSSRDSILLKLFDVDEKNNFRELIEKMSQLDNSVYRKPVDIINLADETASFRLTKKTQRNSLNEIKRMERDFKLNKGHESTIEYDPITVASINSSDSDVEVVPSESSASSTRINPINTLRDSFKDRKVTSGDYLATLDTKYNNKKKETQQKINDARRESDIISKVNHEQSLAHLRNKLKYELCIEESLIVEDQPSVELPPLTPEQENLVSKAMGPGPQGQVLIEKFNLRITRRDLQTLSGLNWLNDEVINFYMNLLMQRCSERKDLPQVYAANTFFYPKLMQSGQAGLRRWTRKVDIFAHDLMVVPVHLGIHWCMSIIDFREKKISYLDSMGGKNQAALNALLQYLRDEHKDKKGQPFDDNGWKTESLKDIPQQMNGSDCGMFACTFAEFSCRNAPYTFTQIHMPYLRRKAVFEILQGKLLL
ncbi:unnamed protein product [Leptosia nina]|uniref:Ubiquitin-like protease family profile domain-containing protein n=1 Tax=Leptosia nina TaxID=320188 RepID=A0AAV1J6M3_9NEOP